MNEHRQWAAFTRAKFKDGQRLGDDVPVVLANSIAAIFDGATGQPNAKGASAGRTAATAAAQALLRFTGTDLMSLDAGNIVNQLSLAVGQAKIDNAFETPIATTAAIIAIGHQTLRLIVVGDTSVRINGSDIYAQEMLVDEISIPARVACFQMAIEKLNDPDLAEDFARRVSTFGLNWAQDNQMIKKHQAADIIASVARKMENRVPPQIVEDYLSKGLVQQWRFANRPNHPLGYGVLDGSAEVLPPFEMTMPINEVKTVEIFSDGYQQPPRTSTIPAWENAYLDLDRADPSRIHIAPAVKGSTSEMWHDDRSVIIMTNE